MFFILFIVGSLKQNVDSNFFAHDPNRLKAGLSTLSGSMGKVLKGSGMKIF
jgi:hypothetical protein